MLKGSIDGTRYIRLIEKKLSDFICITVNYFYLIYGVHVHTHVAYTWILYNIHSRFKFQIIIYFRSI